MFEINQTTITVFIVVALLAFFLGGGLGFLLRRALIQKSIFQFVIFLLIVGAIAILGINFFASGEGTILGIKVNVEVDQSDRIILASSGMLLFVAMFFGVLHYLILREQNKNKNSKDDEDDVGK